MSELLPCPFCGGKARWRYQKPIGWVMCKECGASSAALSDNYEEADCQQEAIAAWNRRADTVSVVRGEWNPIFKGADTCKCSVCKRKGVSDSDYGFIATPYCPNCGAKMESGVKPYEV